MRVKCVKRAIGKYHFKINVGHQYYVLAATALDKAGNSLKHHKLPKP